MSYLDLFVQKEALLRGHFLLSSGLHSDTYLQSALLLQYPSIAAQAGADLAAQLPRVDAVVSPALGGLIIGHEVARAQNVRALFSEKDDQGKPVFRRGFQLARGENVLVIEDVITTGLSTGEVIGLVEASGAVLAGIGSLVNRGGEPAQKFQRWTVPVKSLLTVDVQSWKADDCHLCKKGIPVIKPGSRKQP